MNSLFLKWVHPEAWPSSSFQLPRLQAHRGYWKAGFTENTLPAFRAARVAGFTMCELDIRLSRDGVPVVFHDEDLSRLGGSSRRVNQMTVQELHQHAGAPSLRELLSDAAVPELFNLELKTSLGEVGRIEPAVAQVIRELHAENRVLFSSFNPLSLEALAQILPRVPRALLVTRQKTRGNGFLLRNMVFAPLLKIHLLHLDRSMLNRKLCEDLRRRKIPFAVWTVNDPEEARLFLEWGAASVITDGITRL